MQHIFGWVLGLGFCAVFLFENGPVKINITVIFHNNFAEGDNHFLGIPDFTFDQVITTVNKIAFSYF